MKLITPLEMIDEGDWHAVGGKAASLAVMIRAGMNVPPALSISIHAYHAYVSETGLRDRIAIELNRKDFADMRWEELWDASLRIRNMFLRTAVPDRLAGELLDGLATRFNTRPAAVRSSAPGEDSAQASFAGLHESFVNVRGPEAILDHVKQVWASLWSDAALLYRKELGLDHEKSAMAVLVQEMIAGDVSGIVFGADPIDSSCMVIESVYGLNQGLVDGTVEPDRWSVKRETGEVMAHKPAERKIAVTSIDGGTVKEQLSPEQAENNPLGTGDLDKVIALARRGEELFGSPQDMEWTIREGKLYVLQSRPITAGVGVTEEDNRAWYISLRRSYDNLRALRTRIEQDLIPCMIREVEDMARQDLDSLSDQVLLDEISRRLELFRKWHRVYWDDFIPFAHGIRLFGVVYNNAVRPRDPYEFLQLLGTTELEGLKRNSMLEAMAERVRRSPQLGNELIRGQCSDEQFSTLFQEFMDAYGTLYGAGDQGHQDIMKLIREMSTRDPGERKAVDPGQLRQGYLSHFREEQRDFALDLLDLARSSYSMRDNDNIYLGKVRGELVRALNAFGDRGSGDEKEGSLPSPLREAVDFLNETGPLKEKRGQHAQAEGPYRSHARQIVGQPSGPGLGRGRARVLEKTADLFSFRSGEVLVCDAIDPSMTIVVPLASAIVERRGGMLIHGAIIAREYGIPCVTGIPDATVLIHTGDMVTVDGYLGIVIIGS